MSGLLWFAIGFILGIITVVGFFFFGYLFFDWLFGDKTLSSWKCEHCKGILIPFHNPVNHEGFKEGEWTYCINCHRLEKVR